MRNIHKREPEDKGKPVAEDWSLPGKYDEIFREVENMLARFRASQENEKQK